ncbi:MAG: bifunctional adenosylcobinamide kinase/adenosylcobinamide-phosphate guanylyltransferase [Alphaproteobacteria bacterium]|nr:bifunctional adenosylcobinamide kinase/adenosylcobinamide-phosphate guanylyltransferase [Alphaproteobacteria bacterium]
MTKAEASHGRLTLVLGGARSGKSRYAESLIEALPKPWIYLATAEAGDEEMAARIATHKARRGTDWRTVEVPHDLAAALGKLPAGAAVLIDCLTLWLSNRLLAGADLDAEVSALTEAVTAHDGALVLVANEVGLSLVPDTALGRNFRDLQGLLNQRIAAKANRVILMVAGLPLIVKDSP